MDLTIIIILSLNIRHKSLKNTFLGENTEKYIVFTAPVGIEVTRIDKNGKGITKKISYIL